MAWCLVDRFRARPSIGFLLSISYMVDSSSGSNISDPESVLSGPILSGRVRSLESYWAISFYKLRLLTLLDLDMGEFILGFECVIDLTSFFII